jgi:hypothetical protein
MFWPEKGIFRQHALLIRRSIALYACHYHFTNVTIIIINFSLWFVLSFCCSFTLFIHLAAHSVMCAACWCIPCTYGLSTNFEKSDISFLSDKRFDLQNNGISFT